jgi:hypothetical protein
MLSALTALASGTLTGTVADTAVAITALTGYSATTIKTVSRAIITARTGGLMFTYDGTTPTVLIGRFLAASGNATVEGQQNISRLKFIREAGTSCSISITLETDQS